MFVLMAADTCVSVCLHKTTCVALNERCMKSVMKKVSRGRKASRCAGRGISNWGAKYTTFKIQNTFYPAAAQSQVSLHAHVSALLAD